MKRYVTALTIAGSDPSGGAGVQADIKTMSALGVYAMSAITAITIQNSLGVRGVEAASPDAVGGQIEAVFDDIPPMAVKIGMLFSESIARVTADTLIKYNARNIVLDPVMVATSGDKLISDKAVETITRRLFPISTLITPNVNEAKALTGVSGIMSQCESLRSMGARNILLKGGDDENSVDTSTDFLFPEGSLDPIPLHSPRIATVNTHGTGCTLSSAIASFLALGFHLEDAVKKAKEYISLAISHGADVRTGGGHGPVNHLFSPAPLEIIITK